MNGQYHMPIQGHMNGKVGVVVAAASSAFMGVIGLLAASIPMKGFIGGLKPGIIGIIGGIPMKGVRAVSASRDIADVSFVAGFSASFTWRWVRFADAPRSAIARSVTRIFASFSWRPSELPKWDLPNSNHSGGCQNCGSP